MISKNFLSQKSSSQNSKVSSALYCFCKPRTFYKKRSVRSRIGPHNLDVISVLVESLLGDGHAEKRCGSTRIHIYIHMSHRNQKYLHWLHGFFSKRGYCNARIPKVKPFQNKNGQIFYSCRFVTFSFSSLNWLYDLFYLNGRKKIPLEISELLNPQALSI